MSANVQQVGCPILVGVDGSASALQAVRWAAREAERRRAPLRLIHAYGAPGVVDPESALLWPEYRDVVLKNSEGVLAHAAEQVPAGISVTTEAIDDRPLPRLVTEAEHAQLAVIGDRGLGGVAGLLVGSVAVTMAARAACPVVVVRGREPGGEPLATGPVVVGIDGTPVSEAALAFAFDAADARHVPLMAVHTYDVDVVESIADSMADWAAIATEEREVLAERLAGWGAQYPDVPVERVVLRGRPAPALVRRSKHAQLVVVGSHGRGNLGRLILGSVGHAVLHRAECPVAVVRPGTQP
jgi:nucleotide-binding universal stress UspA family protein